MNEKEINKLYSILDLASILDQQSDFQEIIRLVAQKAAVIIPCETAIIMMLNPQTRETVKTMYATGKKHAERKYHFAHTNISGLVIDNNGSFLTSDLRNDPRFRKNVFKDTSIKSALCIPIRTEATIIGTLLLLNENQDYVFSEDDLVILEKFAAVVSPFLRDVQKIKQLFITGLPKQTLLKKYEAFGLLGKSKMFIELLQTIEAAARTTVKILLEGESGTGKELIAKSIHKLSSRSQNKFLAIDCGAIPMNLIESELFGHVKGAFTDATKDRKGLLEEAHGGTLFMDEITNLPLEMQAKLLRVLQENEIRPLGSNQTRKIDVRIITASSVSLRQLVDQQKFREDLFYRLNVYPVAVPSLDQRREDIPLLATHFLKKFSLEQNKQLDSFQGELLDFIKQHKWQGNIRELANFVERMVTLAPADQKILDIAVLPTEFRDEWQKVKKVHKTDKTSQSLVKSLADYEEKLIRDALADSDWNQSQAARKLRISEHSIRYKMEKLGIRKVE
jgi:transcriptional regulator with GAF, ATPase, and Fis domain